MATACIMIRLRWALMLAEMRRSMWQMIGYIVSFIIGLAALAGVVKFARMVGAMLDAPVVIVGTGAVRMVWGLTMVGTALLCLGCIIFQLMWAGSGMTMDPKMFAMYGIDDRTIHLGMMGASLTGLPSIFGVLGLLIWASVFSGLGVGAVVMAVVAAPLTIVTLMSLSKMVLNLFTALASSSRSRNLTYMVVLIVFIVVCQIPGMVASSWQDAWLESAWSMLSSAAAVLSWTPLAAPMCLPFDVVDGNWLALCVRVAIIAVTWAVCFVVGVWALRRQRVADNAGHSRASAKGLGMFERVPDSVSGAVSARLFTYLVRDVRQAMIWVMPVLFTVVLGIETYANGEFAVAFSALCISGWLMALTEGNGLAYDGQGLAMEVIAGVRGRQERIGRVRVYGVIGLAYLTVIGLVLVALSGAWADLELLLFAVVMWAVGLGLLGCSLGLAQVLSCVLMYPVPSLDRPFASPQGRGVAQGFFPLAHMFGTLVLMLPTVIVAVVVMIFAPLWYGVLAVVALVNGAAVLYGGTVLGGKLLDARVVRIMATLDSFASLQR